MASFRKGNRDLIRQINRNLILNLIKSEGPISRADLARLSHLSPATVSNIMSDFISAGLVHEMGEGESSGGRPPMLLRLNHRAGFVVGVKLMEKSLTGVLTDLDARVLHHRMFSLTTSGNPSVPRDSVEPDTILPDVIHAIEQIIEESPVDRQRVLGIGLGMAGLVDSVAGSCRYSPFFGWWNVPIANPIADHFGLPVYLENDVNTLTIAEKWFGYGHDAEHFIVVTVGRGIGAGIVVNGQLHRGAFGGAGELGHITLVEDGPLCDCGKRGCLESLASDPAVLRQALEGIARGERTMLADTKAPTMEAITAAAEAGDAFARRLLGDAGRWLGIGIATLVNILNPHLLIIGGEGVQAGEWRFGPMQEAIQAHSFDGLADSLEIVIEPSSDETWARGAACVVLGELFKSPVHR